MPICHSLPNPFVTKWARVPRPLVTNIRLNDFRMSIMAHMVTVHCGGAGAPPWQCPCRVPRVLPLSRAGGRSPVPIRRRVEPNAALRVCHHHVPVDERVRGRAEEAAVEDFAFFVELYVNARLPAW